MSESAIAPIKFSSHFKLDLEQPSLDFVDIPVNTDIPLFLDPFSLTMLEGEWGVNATNLLNDFFERLLVQVTAGKKGKVMDLLSHVGEANDAHLGYSRGRPRGSGIGRKKADRLANTLLESEAAVTGILQDISEADLFIEGVAEDNVSDLCINLLRPLLLSYTLEQCELHEIPTRPVDGGACWDPKAGWSNTMARLPMYGKERIILIPKCLVRRNLSLSSKRFYDYYVLDYLEQMHLRAGDSLVTLLRGGRKRVYKKDLKQKYPFSKNYVADFVQEHPDVFEQFVKEQRAALAPLSNEDLNWSDSDPISSDLPDCEELRAIPAGREAAGVYHNFITSALQAIFYPDLTLFKKEQDINEGRKRIDIVAENVAVKGFFHNLSVQQQIKCPYIFFECKNYGVDLKNPEFDQMAGRFSAQRSKFGFIVCRSIQDKRAAWKRCRDLINDNSEYILILEDDDICNLLEMRGRGDWEGIQNYLRLVMRRLTFGENI